MTDLSFGCQRSAAACSEPGSLPGGGGGGGGVLPIQSDPRAPKKGLFSTRVSAQSPASWKENMAPFLRSLVDLVSLKV